MYINVNISMYLSIFKLMLDVKVFAASAGELPEQSIPQLQALLLRLPDDVIYLSINLFIYISIYIYISNLYIYISICLSYYHSIFRHCFSVSQMM